MLDDSVRLKFMLGKLKGQVDGGFIENEWAEQFINDMVVRLKQNLPISHKQGLKIEELYEQY